MQQISDEYLERVVTHGYTVVPDFLSHEELAAARANMLRYVPTAQELAAAPERYPWVFEDPENLQIEFPFAGEALNDVSTHPQIIGFVERLLGTHDILLSQAAVWPKYAGTGDFDQTMHLDYEGNTLTCPRDDGIFRQVNMILYYTDMTEEMGPTCVVPTDLTRRESMWPPFRPRKKYPDLYANEKKILASAGSLLIFGMRTFHRASEMTAAHGARFSHHLVYRAAACSFNGYHQYSHFGEKPEMRNFIQRAAPRQREVLGFPPPGHPYWNAETLAGVAARYPKMDMKPYLMPAAAAAEL